MGDVAARSEVVFADVAALTSFCAAALTAAGATASDAATAADVMVSTDARGVHSHGVQALPIHIRNLQDGGTTSPVEVRIERERPVTAVVDGCNGMGMVVATRAMQLAIDKASASGVAVVLVRNSNHLGATGHYALQAADAGLIGLATSNASPIMTAAGSRRKQLSNAPFAYAVPTGRFPLLLDIAMSASAGFKVRMAAERGEDIPLGWVVDADGRPTTDPAAYAAGGALLPVGGHKGYGMALLTETLAGALAGAGMTSAVVPWLRDTGTPTRAGHAFMAMDITCFMDRDTFHSRMQALVDDMHTAEPAPGVDRVRVPGELEAEEEQRARAEGVRLEPMIWARLEETAEQFGLTAQLEDVPVTPGQQATASARAPAAHRQQREERT